MGSSEDIAVTSIWWRQDVVLLALILPVLSERCRDKEEESTLSRL